MNQSEILTNELDDVIRGMQISLTDTGLDRTVLHADIGNESFLVLEQRGVVRLSDETRAMEEARLAKLHRKKQALRNRKPYTRKRGTVHPKKKAATRRRRLEKNWENNPFGVVIHGYGAHAIDRDLWDKHIQPLFTEYSPHQLTLKKLKRDLKGRYYGTKVNPFTVYSLQIEHKQLGTVFDGSSLELHHLSGGI